MSNYTYTWALVNAVLIFITSILAVIRYISVRDIVESNSIEAEIVESHCQRNNMRNFHVKYRYHVNGKKLYSKYDPRLVTDYKRFVDNNPIGTKLKVFISNRKPKFVLLELPTRGNVIFYASKPFVIFVLLVNVVFIYWS